MKVAPGSLRFMDMAEYFAKGVARKLPGLARPLSPRVVLSFRRPSVYSVWVVTNGIK